MKCPYCGIRASSEWHLIKHLSGTAKYGGHGVPKEMAKQIIDTGKAPPLAETHGLVCRGEAVAHRGASTNTERPSSQVQPEALSLASLGTSSVESSSPPTYGPQYSKDEPFKAAARLHQSRFRVHRLKVDGYRDYGNRLPESAASEGRIFCSWPGVAEAAWERFGKGDTKLYWDMLASDHIPFNIFIPLKDSGLAVGIVESWTRSQIRQVTTVCVEWAPAPKECYLSDNTSFDAYIEYRES